MKKITSELLGTFALVFAGTGAIVINDVSHGTITHAGIALTFGLIVLAMIYTFGDVSGAHLNPAVTLGFFAAGRMPGREVFPYVVAQVIGATPRALDHAHESRRGSAGRSQRRCAGCDARCAS